MKHVTCQGFVGLNSRMYTFITEGNRDSKKAKGINNTVDDELQYKDYENVLFNISFMTREMNRIQSKDCNIILYS